MTRPRCDPRTWKAGRDRPHQCCWRALASPAGLPGPSGTGAAHGLAQPAPEEPEGSSCIRTSPGPREGWGPGLGSSHCTFAIGTLGPYTLRRKARGPPCVQGVLSGCCPGYYRELWALSGRNLPSGRVGAPCHWGVHLEWGEHPWSWCWMTPAQVGSELGSEAPSDLGAQRATSS